MSKIVFIISMFSILGTGAHASLKKQPQIKELSCQAHNGSTYSLVQEAGSQSRNAIVEVRLGFLTREFEATLQKRNDGSKVIDAIELYEGDAAYLIKVPLNLQSKKRQNLEGIVVREGYEFMSTGISCEILLD